MTLSLSQTLKAIGSGRTSSFLGVGGTAPYGYAVLAGGAGGTIDPTTGVYVAPAVASSNVLQAIDTIQVTDAAAATATATILVGTPLLLFCDILQRELGLADGRVYLWDQKLMQPKDAGLYVAVTVGRCKPFGNNNRAASGGGGLDDEAYVAMHATLDVDVISRGPDARDRKEEVLLALASTYSQQQQEANSFYVATLPVGQQFINLSQVDGAAIPYRYRISVAMQYAATRTKAAPYFDNNFDATVETIEP